MSSDSDSQSMKASNCRFSHGLRGLEVCMTLASTQNTSFLLEVLLQTVNQFTVRLYGQDRLELLNSYNILWHNKSCINVPVDWNMWSPCGVRDLSTPQGHLGAYALEACAVILHPPPVQLKGMPLVVRGPEEASFRAMWVWVKENMHVFASLLRRTHQ